METSVEKPHDQQLKPKKFHAVSLILSVCCIERYVGNSTIAILVLYLNRKLFFDESTSTAIMHINDCLLYFFTIIGAIISDSWWGAYKTISRMMVIYLCGTVIVTIGAIESLNLPTIIFLSFNVYWLDNNCCRQWRIRPNLNAFGGSQYKLPEQSDELRFFFSIQYFLMKCGSLAAYLLAPTLRGDVKCFGMNDCYPLAFGVPSAAIFLSFIIFMSGTPMYVRTKPNGNGLLKVFSCIFHALSQKLKLMRQNICKSHWLDYAEEKYGAKLVEDTKLILNVLVMFLPIPIYWTGYLLQNSRWVFQAAKMDGQIGSFVVKPDQMLIFNPMLALTLFPICEYILHPLLAKVGIKTMLQKMTLGGMMGAIGVGLSTLIEIKIQNNYLSILWLIPQYFFMVLSENFMFIAIQNFAYSEAPKEMKSVTTSFVFVTVAGGILIVAFIAGMKFFSSQVYEFLFFTILIVIDMVFFGFLATRYNYGSIKK